MKSKYLYIVISILISCLGCGSVSVWNKSTLQEKGLVTSGQVVDLERLKEGGRLAVLPFRAGTGVPANDKLDAMSLMIIKGVIDTLEQSNVSIEIVTASDYDKADLVMKGHIIQYIQPKGIKKLFGKKITRLGVDGQLLDQNTGNIILYFSDIKMFSKDKQGIDNVAYGIGQGIGKFILNASNKKGI